MWWICGSEGARLLQEPICIHVVTFNYKSHSSNKEVVEKNTKRKRDLHKLFIDLEKKYDNVSRGFYGDVWGLEVYCSLH